MHFSMVGNLPIPESGSKKSLGQQANPGNGCAADPEPGREGRLGD